jgi:hypothetical protein
MCLICILSDIGFSFQAGSKVNRQQTQSAVNEDVSKGVTDHFHVSRILETWKYCLAAGSARRSSFLGHLRQSFFCASAEIDLPGQRFFLLFLLLQARKMINGMDRDLKASLHYSIIPAC